VGCGDDDDRYAVVTSWAVNALAPTHAVCEREDIVRVRLTIMDGARERTIETACTRSHELRDGYRYGGFVTTRVFDFDVTYPFEVALLDARGKAVESQRGSIAAQRGDVTPLELPTLERFSPLGDAAAVIGPFRVGGDDPARRCEQAGVNRVEMWLYSAFEDLTKTPPQPVRALHTDCALGRFDSRTPLLAVGDYQVVYAALDLRSTDDYRVVKRSDPISVTVERAGTLTLPEIDLDL
jgi:hypothetical protein